MHRQHVWVNFALLPELLRWDLSGIAVTVTVEVQTHAFVICPENFALLSASAEELCAKGSFWLSPETALRPNR